MFLKPHTHTHLPSVVTIAKTARTTLNFFEWIKVGGENEEYWILLNNSKNFENKKKIKKFITKTSIIIEKETINMTTWYIHI